MTVGNFKLGDYPPVGEEVRIRLTEGQLDRGKLYAEKNAVDFEQ